MTSIKKRIEGLIYPHLEKYITSVYDMGTDAVLFGIRVMDDTGGNYTRSALVHTTAMLYIHYMKNGDKRAEKTLEMLNGFINLMPGLTVKTWGKISLLRAYVALKKAGLMDKVDNTNLDIIKEQTDYSDFFDAQNLSISGYASNYIQVALAIAAMREYLGWEDKGASTVAGEFLMNVAKGGSPLGFTDEEVGRGRFDRYSFLLTSELSDSLLSVDRDIPDWARENLTLSSTIALKMANARGDGFNYGRSLSCHGDCAVAEVLSSALSRGLVGQKDVPLALAYISKIIDKTLNFWFDKEKESFNIWWDGRSTNRYRQVKRVLEVNLDMCVHLSAILENLERAGIADTEPDESVIPSPLNWEFTRLDFAENRTAVFLRHGDILASVPLIGLGNKSTFAAYMPFPAICKTVESAPEAKHPFLVPEYTVSANTLRPVEYYDEIKTEKNGERVVITAHGTLAIYDERYTQRSDYRFTVKYTFNNEKISVSFETDAPANMATMIIGTQNSTARIIPVGTYVKEPLSPVGDYDFMTPHGQIDSAYRIIFTKTNKLGYEILL